MTQTQELARRQPAGVMQVGVFADGDGKQTTALVKRTSRGAVRNMLVQVRLRADKGETYQMGAYDPQSRSWVKKTCVTAAGYHRLNQFCGVSFNTPSSVCGDDGRDHPNPWFERVDGEVRAVTIRLIGLGRNATGNRVQVDYTLRYDLHTYFVQDVWAKWSGKKKDAAVKDWGTVFPAGHIPGEIANLPYIKTLPTPGGLVLALDLRERDVLALFQEHISRQKFAERNARTICERNILKRFLAAVTIDPAGTVGVVSWSQLDDEWHDVADQTVIAEGGQSETPVIIDAVVDSVSSKDEVDEALTGDVDEDADQVAPAPEGAAEPSDEDVEILHLQAMCRELINTKAGWAKVLSAHDMEPADIGTCRSIDLLDMVRGELLALPAVAPKTARKPRKKPAPQGTLGLPPSGPVAVEPEGRPQ